MFGGVKENAVDCILIIAVCPLDSQNVFKTSSSNWAKFNILFSPIPLN